MSHIKPTRRSLGTVTSIEGARQSSSAIPLDQLAKYLRFYFRECIDGEHDGCMVVTVDGAPCACPCHDTPADPGADECAADAAGEWLADLRMDGDL